MNSEGRGVADEIRYFENCRGLSEISVYLRLFEIYPSDNLQRIPDVFLKTWEKNASFTKFNINNIHTKFNINNIQ